MILEIGLFFLIIIIYALYCVFYPLLIGYSLKLKYGKSILIRFYPMLGLFHYDKISKKKYYDAIVLTLEVLKKNPETKIIVTNLGFRPLLLVVDPEVAKDLSVKYSKHYRFLEGSLMMVALFRQRFSFGEQRKKQRKMWGKAFEFSHLENYMGILRKEMKDLDQTLCKEQQKNPQEKQFNPKIYLGLQSVVSRVILEGFWSSDRKISNVQVKGLPIYAQVTKIFVDSTEFMKTNPLYMMKMKFFEEKAPYYFQTKEEKEILERSDEVRQHCINEIEDRLQEYKKGVRKNDQLDIFLENYMLPDSDPQRALYTKQDIMVQFMNFFFAGTHTASLFGTLGLQLLAHYQDVQSQVRREIQDYTKKTGKFIKDFQISDVNQLEILDMFTKEFFRYNGTQKTVFQECTENHFLNEFQIKKGWLLQVGTGEIARSEKYWKDPENFDIQRWNRAKNQQEQIEFQPFTYLPFWAGPRNCIGQHLAILELKFIWITILNKYILTVPENQPFQRFKLLDENTKHITFTPVQP